MIEIEFMPSSVFEGKDINQKITLILKNVKKKRIVVIEDPLSPEEEALLIQSTMETVSDDFSGIEVASFGKQSDGLKAKLISLLGGKSGGMTIVGPAELVKRIKKEPTRLHLFTNE